MSEQTLKMGQGMVVTDERFWDREKEMQLLIERIDDGAHQLLVAQRRMGKTSLMAEAEKTLAGRYICLFVDVQSCSTPADVIVALSLEVKPHKGLWEKTKQIFRNVLDGIRDNLEELQLGEVGVTLRSGMAGGNWIAKGDQLFQVLADSQMPVVVFIDELPILVNRLLRGDEDKVTPEGKRRADEFMSWLRENGIRHQGKIRTVVSGSIGLGPVLHQARLSATVNNLLPLEIGAWDAKTAIGCLRALAAECEIELASGVPEAMVDRLGCCIPHHVQMFFTHIHERCTKRGVMKCTLSDAEEVYKKDMLGVRGHVELVHYEERLEHVLDKEACTLALDMLTEAAVVGRLTGQALKAFQNEHVLAERDPAEIQKEILWVLEHDGYLKKDTEGYVFVSKLVRDWWRNRYEHFFTSVLERS